MDLKWTISEEERTRHDALFYSQKPQDRYLSGEQARSLFIRSKLPLPELSKIWKLADVSRNNKLDIAEFAVAMHLIQSRLKGTDIPLKLPETLSPKHLPRISIPFISEEEKAAYERAFRWKNGHKTGYIDAETACSVLIGSGLLEDILARIWDLSDIDRDGKLSLEEFLIAVHITRFCKQGNSIEGNVNVRSILSEQLTEECYDSKRLRLAEVQTEKRKLLSVKEKLCHEIAGDLEEEVMAQKIQDELDQVERRVYVLEKEENELRRALQKLKDKSKRESFKPFDRSFLLKRQPTGEDIFRGAYKNHRVPVGGREDEEILTLWREDGDLKDFGATISEEPSIPTSPTNIYQDQSGRTVIELSENHQPCSPDSSKASLESTSPAINGFESNVDAERLHSVYSNNNENEDNKNKTDPEARNEERAEEGDKSVEKKGLSHVDKDKQENLIISDSSPSNLQPTVNGGNASELTQQQELHSSTIADSNSEKNTMNENRTDDEKTGALRMATQNGICTTDSEKEALKYDSGALKSKPATQGSFQAPLEETIDVVTAPSAESSAASRMDGLLLKLEEDDGNLIRNEKDIQMSNGEGTSPRSLTQDELIPYVMEEKKRKDEERAKQREIDNEMRRKAREELDKQKEENKKMAEQRKAKFEEERQRLEKQTALAQEKQEPKKAPLSRTEAGRMIEEELEQQRVREELMRIENEKIKEKERLEVEKQKSKHAKKEEHPLAFHNKDLVQKPIFDERKDVIDGSDTQGLRISSKRGSVIDLSAGDDIVHNEVKKRPLENRPSQELLQTHRQPQEQSQPQPQPVVRRAKENGKVTTTRKAENRKSFVQLDIERQKEREEELRREAEIARKIHLKKQMEGGSKDVEVLREEVAKTKEYHPESNGVDGKTTSTKKQTEIEAVVQQTNTQIIESPPVDQLDAKQAAENGTEMGETQRNAEEEEKRRKREEEKELFRQMQEQEKKRREAQKADLERIRKEVDRKEAEEMMRVKLEKEEEKKKQREEERRKAEERQKDKMERQKLQENQSETRRTAFAAHKLILEQRVLKALEESKQEATGPRRRASNCERLTEGLDLDEPSPPEEGNDDSASVGVKLRKANFENTAARKDSNEELRKKRYSLNLDQFGQPITSSTDASVKSKHPGSVGKKYADDVFDKGTRAQIEREEELLRRVGWKAPSNEGKLTKAKSVGDLSMKKGQNEDKKAVPVVLRRVSFVKDDTDSADGIPTFSDSRIQRELEEQRMREAIVKKETSEAEKRHRLEEGKKKVVEVASDKKDLSLKDIKRNPLPNKIQVKKPTNRDSLTHSMATHWENMLQSQEGNEAVNKKEVRKSRIEMEREEERRREEELQKERERVKLEIKQKEEANKSEQQRKMEEEMEKKRKAKEEKEKRQQRTSAMKSMFEKMGGKK